jgi:hypothetical protein
MRRLPKSISGALRPKLNLFEEHIVLWIPPHILVPVIPVSESANECDHCNLHVQMQCQIPAASHIKQLPNIVEACAAEMQRTTASQDSSALSPSCALLAAKLHRLMPNSRPSRLLGSRRPHKTAS